MERIVRGMKLTSPGVLLIVAVLAAGGIFLLDAFYLQPHVTGQRDAALREQATKTASSGRLALQAEEASLLSICSTWAQNGEIAGLIGNSTCEKRFAALADKIFCDKQVELAWLSDRKGKIAVTWTCPTRHQVLKHKSALAAVLTERTQDFVNHESDSDVTLIKISSQVIMLARQKIGGDKTNQYLWMGRFLNSSSLERIGSTIGSKLVFVAMATVPQGAFADKSQTHALWPIGEDKLAVAWLAYNAGGKALGCFRADVQAVHIYRQASAARRMSLIVLSMSIALSLLVIMGTHILIAGPVIRLLKRLKSMEVGQENSKDLSKDLHGEPLVLARQLESAFDKLAHMSQTDQLTELANRRHFEEVLDCFYHQARRYNRPLSLIIMDIDFFKAINDTGGHAAGDDLLKVVAGIIEQACRKADLPARFGGDEFAVLLPETSIEDAAAVAERIREAVCDDDYQVNSVQVNVTMSIGLTDLNAGAIDSGETMLALADRALYAAKEGGRNRVVRAYDLDGIGFGHAEKNGKINTLYKKLAGLDNQFKGLFLQAIEEIMEILEQRDPHMADHALKVQRYAVLLAQEMELPERVVKRIEIAAMLHDIGMLAMPDAVLLCPHELDDKKLKIMQKHPLYSVRIMEGMEFLEQEIPAVRYHHERYDGQGYPEGLTGAAIPLTARILAVADIFDAMTSFRTFRDAKSCQDALAELQRVAGSQLDPVVVETFVTMANRMGDELMNFSREAETTDERQATGTTNDKCSMINAQ